MVELTPTPALRAALALYNSLPTTTESVADALSRPSIDHPTIIAVSRALYHHHSSTGDADAYTLSTLLRGTAIYTPPPPPRPEPTPEYKALMARLRADAEAREYARMTGGDVDGQQEQEEENAFLMADLRTQMTVIVNVLLSTVATAVAVWMVAGGYDVPARLGAAFTTALVVCVAEVVLFGGYVRRIQEAREREAKKKEEKEVVGTWEITKEVAGLVKKIA